MCGLINMFGPQMTTGNFPILWESQVFGAFPWSFRANELLINHVIVHLLKTMFNLPCWFSRESTLLEFFRGLKQTEVII